MRLRSVTGRHPSSAFMGTKLADWKSDILVYVLTKTRDLRRFGSVQPNCGNHGYNQPHIQMVIWATFPG